MVLPSVSLWLRTAGPRILPGTPVAWVSKRLLPLVPLLACGLLFKYRLNSAKSSEKLDKKVALRLDSVVSEKQHDRVAKRTTLRL